MIVCVVTPVDKLLYWQGQKVEIPKTFFEEILSSSSKDYNKKERPVIDV